MRFLIENISAASFMFTSLSALFIFDINVCQNAITIVCGITD